MKLHAAHVGVWGVYWVNQPESFMGNRWSGPPQKKNLDPHVQLSNFLRKNQLNDPSPAKDFRSYYATFGEEVDQIFPEEKLPTWGGGGVFTSNSSNE